MVRSRGEEGMCVEKLGHEMHLEMILISQCQQCLYVFNTAYSGITVVLVQSLTQHSLVSIDSRSSSTQALGQFTVDEE